MTRPLRAVFVCALALGLAMAPTSAFAAQTATAGTTKCTITAKAPTLNASKQLTGSVSITCTALAVVTIDTLVVEMDGTVEQTVSATAKTSSVSVAKNATVTVSTFTTTCPNTEVGNEEYASKGRVIVSGSSTWSAWDRTAPANDSYAC